jgi:hypothetical protein
VNTPRDEGRASIISIEGERAARIPAPPPDVSEWAPFELALSFDTWLAARGIDYLHLRDGREVDRLRSEWLARKGEDANRLGSEWLRTAGGPSAS